MTHRSEGRDAVIASGRYIGRASGRGKPRVPTYSRYERPRAVRRFPARRHITRGLRASRQSWGRCAVACARQPLPSHGRGLMRVQDLASRRCPMAAAHRRQTSATLSASRPVAGCTSIHSTCGNRSRRDRCVESPHRVWFVPGRQAWTSPAGIRKPSGSVHEPVAATAAAVGLGTSHPAKLMTRTLGPSHDRLYPGSGECMPPDRSQCRGPGAAEDPGLRCVGLPGSAAGPGPAEQPRIRCLPSPRPGTGNHRGTGGR